MSEINKRLSFKNNSLSSLFNKFEKDLATYVNTGQDLGEKNKRKTEVVSAIENLASKLRSKSAKCPEGTVWDPVTRTCKPA